MEGCHLSMLLTCMDSPSPSLEPFTALYLFSNNYLKSFLSPSFGTVIRDCSSEILEIFTGLEAWMTEESLASESY